MKRILVDEPDLIYEKILRAKADDGFEIRSFSEYFAWKFKNIRLDKSIEDRVAQGTKKDLFDVWVENWAGNLPFMRGLTCKKCSRDEFTTRFQQPSKGIYDKPHSVAELISPRVNTTEKMRDTPPFMPALVIGRGPSLFEKNHLKQIAESDYAGTIVLTDGILKQALEAGITPDKFRKIFVTTVDGSRSKIWNWFDSSLVRKHGPQMKAIVAANVAPNTVLMIRIAHIPIYWVQSMYSPEDPLHEYSERFDDLQRRACKTPAMPNGPLCMNMLGNTGSFAWLLAWSVLHCSPVILVGMNLGYLPGTRLEDTSYGDQFLKAAGGDYAIAKQGLWMVQHPVWGPALTDGVFEHYRNAFVDTVQKVPFKWLETINATEGGALFCDGYIKCMSLAEALEKVSKKQIYQKAKSFLRWLQLHKIRKRRKHARKNC